MSNEDIIELIEMVDSGKYYIKEIAEWFGINYSTVRRVYRRYKNANQTTRYK